ncbi:hypothetical protein LTR09_010358 [Extremus antarcticus]|uniref:Uncharacterized protein n=1 Tax=Extremus antarcticus TaxID=702011 RepID=A0AAJ0D7L5_9PEZI|nr:hypothetical protein LTR09_010358 [Extremus antarcticus]
MKLSTFLLPAFSLLATSAVAAPTSVEHDVVERAAVVSPLRDWLTSLNTEVQGYTTHMTQVANAVPADASKKQKQVAAASVIKDINSITHALTSLNTKLIIAKANSDDSTTSDSSALEIRQNLSNLPKNVLGQLNGKPIVFANLLNELVNELDPAIQSVLVTLSLGEVNAALQPLLKVQLPGLLTNVGNLVNGLLVALAPLLTSLGGILGPLLLGLGL